MCETEEDCDALVDAYDALYELEVVDSWPKWAEVVHLPTPKMNGEYIRIPYSHKINSILMDTQCDLICYLDNGSMPAPEKYKVMAEALEQNPSWGAVYCTQHRTGFNEVTSFAHQPVSDAYCALNYTQVMHRRTLDLWTEDMDFANPDLADAMFWRDLHESLGDFWPVGGDRVLDDHHIPNPSAAL